jgi:hypothetical protein
MKKFNFYKIVLFIFISFVELYAQKFNLPIIQYDKCPFECCRYGNWKTFSSLKVYKVEGDTTSYTFTITAIDSFKAITGNVHIIKPGRVIIKKSNGIFLRGDTVYTLSYTGEGFNDVLYHGKVYNIEIFWQTDDEMDFGNINVNDDKWKNYKGVLISRPIMVWWVRIRYRNSRDGWIPLENEGIEGFLINERIEGMDGCR